MKYCWTGSDGSRNMIAPGIILVGALGIAGIVKNATVAENPTQYVLVTSVLFAFVYFIPACIAYISSRQYRIDRNGITLQYPFGITKQYDWENISEISLCKVHYATSSNAHILAIRCVIGPEDLGPSKAVTSREPWSTIRYELLHFRSIVTIYYSDERYKEFCEFCPHCIADYRRLKDRL